MKRAANGRKASAYLRLCVKKGLYGTLAGRVAVVPIAPRGAFSVQFRICKSEERPSFQNFRIRET